MWRLYARRRALQCVAVQAVIVLITLACHLRSLEPGESSCALGPASAKTSFDSTDDNGDNDAALHPGGESALGQQLRARCRDRGATNINNNVDHDKMASWIPWHVLPWSLLMLFKLGSRFVPLAVAIWWLLLRPADRFIASRSKSVVHHECNTSVKKAKADVKHSQRSSIAQLRWRLVNFLCIIIVHLGALAIVNQITMMHTCGGGGGVAVDDYVQHEHTLVERARDLELAWFDFHPKADILIRLSHAFTYPPEFVMVLTSRSLSEVMLWEVLTSFFHPLNDVAHEYSPSFDASTRNCMRYLYETENLCSAWGFKYQRFWQAAPMNIWNLVTCAAVPRAYTSPPGA